MRISVGMATAVLLLSLLFASSCQGSGAVGITPPGQAGQAVWAMAGGNSRHQGRTALNGPQQGSRQWSVSLEGYISFAPTIAPDGTTYVVQRDALSALSPDGEELWRYSAAESIVAPAHLDNSGLIWGVTSGKWDSEALVYDGGGVFALNPDGSLNRWTDTGDANPKRAAFDTAGASYILADTRYTDDDLLCIEPSGDERWRVSSEDYRDVSWFAATGGIVSFRRDGKLQFYDAADGRRSGEIDVEEQGVSTYAVDEAGGIYVAERGESSDGDAVKKITADNTVIWETPLELRGYVGRLYLGRNQQLYIVDDVDRLNALSLSGAMLWRYPQAGDIIGLAADGTVYTFLGRNGRSDVNVIAPDGSLTRTIPDTKLYDLLSGVSSIYIGELPLAVGLGGQMLWTLGLLGSSYYYPRGLNALDADGAVLWSRVSAGPLEDNGPLIDAAGNCYGANSNLLVSVAPDGGFRWSRSSLDEYTAAPVILNGELIVTATRNNDLTAYRLDGSLAWQTSLGGYNDSQGLAAGAGRVYLASGEFLYCLDSAGQVRYQLALSNSSYGAPAIAADGTAYISDNAGACYALSPDGEQLWRVEVDSPLGWEYPVIASPEQILFPLAGGVLALDPQGIELWRMALDQPYTYSAAPAVGEDGALYLPLYVTVQSTEVIGNWLYALDSDGSVRWKLELADRVTQQPVVDGSGLIYMGDWDSQLVIASPSGTILSGADEEQPVFPGAVGGSRGFGIAPNMQLLTCGDSLESYGL